MNTFWWKTYWFTGNGFLFEIKPWLNPHWLNLLVLTRFGVQRVKKAWKMQPAEHCHNRAGYSPSLIPPTYSGFHCYLCLYERHALFRRPWPFPERPLTDSHLKFSDSSIHGIPHAPRHGPLHYWVPSAHSPYHADWRSSVANLSSTSTERTSDLTREEHGCAKSSGHAIETTGST